MQGGFQNAKNSKINPDEKKLNEDSKPTNTTAKKPQSTQRQKKKSKYNPSSATGLLGFKVDSKPQPYSRTLKHSPPQRISDITLNPYYKFAVSSGDYHLFHMDPDLSIPWELVQKVFVLQDSEAKCPICLENELLAARVNKCGHYFCWPCIIRYQWHTRGVKKCPVCNDYLKASDLRPLSIYLHSRITEGKTAEFSLVKRPKGMISLFTNSPTEPTCMGLFRSDSSNMMLNKITIYNQGLSDYSVSKENLQRALSTPDEFERSSIMRALELLENTAIPSIDCRFDTLLSSRNLYYFYQLQDCQPYFLHPLNISMLKKQHCEYENFPEKISGKILEIEMVHVTDSERKKHGLLAHIAKNAVVYFVEIDMKNYCSQDVMKYYSDELLKRQKNRQRFRRIEEKIQAKIVRRRKGEEEANNLLVSYFENPVIAPVKHVVEEKMNEEKNEDKKQDGEEEEETKSKSIWGKFTEILKKPPRENIRTEPEKKTEETKEEEEGPPKLTMFDLIKVKRK